MDLPPFLLDRWLATYEFRDPPMRYNLATSTGPHWSLGSLRDVLGVPFDLDHATLSYAPPNGSPDLRAAIADFLGVDPAWVVVTTGASEALSILFCLAAEAQANVVMSQPGFPSCAALAEAWGLAVKPFQLERERGFDQDAASILASVDAGTKLVLVNTPHNPTGSVIAPAELCSIAAQLDRRRVPLVADEVYHPLYFGDAHPSAAAIDNVIVIGDMSKAMSLAGLRVGWIVDADAERRQRIIDTRSYFTISSSPLSEAIAAEALRHHGAILEQLGRVARANLACFSDGMKRVADKIGWVPPAGGTTVFPWFRDGRDARPFCETLAERQLLIVPGDCFGKPDHMRIGFAAQQEDFAGAIELLIKALC